MKSMRPIVVEPRSMGISFYASCFVFGQAIAPLTTPCCSHILGGGSGRMVLLERCLVLDPHRGVCRNVIAQRQESFRTARRTPNIPSVGRIPPPRQLERSRDLRSGREGPRKILGRRGKASGLVRAMAKSVGVELALGQVVRRREAERHVQLRGP